MSIESPGTRAATLVGRATELATIDGLVAAGRAGRSGVLVIRGEAGIGKSALLQHATTVADGMTVLKAVGTESESVLAFAGLHQLLRPLLRAVDRLPPPQAEALRAAFALSADTVDDPFRVGVGVLSLLSDAAEERPLLCVIDDAQWLDQASAEALLFAARRMQAEAIAVLIAVREDGTSDLPTRGLPDLQLAALTPEDARRLTAERLSQDVSADVVDWVVANARGNPLALLELGVNARTGGQVPPTTSVEEAYIHRINRLPDEVRQLVALAAAEESGDQAVIALAARSLGLDPYQLAVAEREGLIEVQGGTITFRHPLVRSAAYRGARFDVRERAHRALAGALTSPVDSDRRAWHRAAAAVGYDDDVAGELEESAGRARNRGGHGAAAAALVRAAELSAGTSHRRRRLTLAAVAANAAGQNEAAVRLVDRASDLDPDPVTRADLALLRGSAALLHGRPDEISDRLVAAAEEVASIDPLRALQLAGAAVEAAALGCDVDRISRAAAVSAAVAPASDDPRQQLLSLVPQGGELMFKGAVPQSARVFGRAARLPLAATTPRDVVWQAITAVLAGDYATGQARYSAAAAQARELGAVGTLWYVLTGQAMCNVYFGYLSEAAEAAHEAVQLAADVGAEEHAAHAKSVLGWVAELSGADPRKPPAGAAESHDISRGIALPSALLAWGRAERALAGGRWVDALADFTDLSAYRRGFGHPLVAVASAPGLVEAAVRSGRRELAEGPIELLTVWAAHLGPRHRRPLLARALGLSAATPDAAIHHFEEAIRLHGSDGSPYETARTQLLFGQLLRRERRKTDARVHLRAALRGFERVGAEPWARLAAGELRATGEASTRHESGKAARLTPQELQIARLAGDGGSNKDIAAQLFLSPRTVEYHLSKLFLKLGIASRAELMGRDLGVPVG